MVLPILENLQEANMINTQEQHSRTQKTQVLLQARELTDTILVERNAAVNIFKSSYKTDSMSKWLLSYLSALSCQRILSRILITEERKLLRVSMDSNINPVKKIVDSVWNRIWNISQQKMIQVCHWKKSWRNSKKMNFKSMYGQRHFYCTYSFWTFGRVPGNVPLLWESVLFEGKSRRMFIYFSYKWKISWMLA